MQISPAGQIGLFLPSSGIITPYLLIIHPFFIRRALSPTNRKSQKITYIIHRVVRFVKGKNRKNREYVENAAS